DHAILAALQSLMSDFGLRANVGSLFGRLSLRLLSLRLDLHLLRTLLGGEQLRRRLRGMLRDPLLELIRVRVHREALGLIEPEIIRTRLEGLVSLLRSHKSEWCDLLLHRREQHQVIARFLAGAGTETHIRRHSRPVAPLRGVDVHPLAAHLKLQRLVLMANHQGSNLEEYVLQPFSETPCDKFDL